MTEMKKTGYKIREAQVNKIPCMLIVGDKEMENETVAFRSREKGDEGEMKINDLVERLLGEIREKK